MHSSVIPLAVLLGTVPQYASAWGDLGHMTVAYIAQNYLTSEAVSWAQNILADTSDSYLANVATWADDYKYTSEGAYSYPYHFIDANDSPPSSCNVDYDRDCGDTGCSVSAIANYTSRVQSTSLPSEETQEALKYLVHFIGDITQPLHDEAYEVGGNDIDVTFDGESTNLHHIWDTDMLEKLRGGYSQADAQTWANDLTDEINSGEYSSDKSSWVEGLDVSDAVSSSMAWASDANAFVCSSCLKGGESSVDHGDLDGSYYEAAVPIFEEQIAKAGYRLGAWLNAIVANGGSSGGSGGSSSGDSY